jgi:dimethylhistidine N-methyltransferase
VSADIDTTITCRDDKTEILVGLRQPQKIISPKFFYDEAGSRLFDEICRQPEYYPTRTELDIMHRHIDDIVHLIGPRASIIEFGSGSSIKTRLLLEKLIEPAVYVPVDISREHLAQTAASLSADFPDIEILPICADFTQPFALPTPKTPPEKNIVFFPGSTIGNFSTRDAINLMRVMRTEARNDGALLIGVDLEKPKIILERAYNDAAGVTAKFNLNLLIRFNREYDADFELRAFEHEAVYDEKEKRIEMRLISLRRQSVHIAGARIDLDVGEYIVTEHSHKYSPDRFADMTRQAGFEFCQAWSDADNLFSVQYLTAAEIEQE